MPNIAPKAIATRIARAYLELDRPRHSKQDAGETNSVLLTSAIDSLVKATAGLGDALTRYLKGHLRDAKAIVADVQRYEDRDYVDVGDLAKPALAREYPGWLRFLESFYGSRAHLSRK